MNLSAVSGLAARPIASVWYRAIQPGYLQTALDHRHTRRVASRYYAGPGAVVQPFDILYFAQDPFLAQLEVGGLLGTDALWVANSDSTAWLTLNAQCQLSKVADLTDVKVHEQLGTSTQELTGDWKRYNSSNLTISAPTQQLGRAIHHSGAFEGFVAISAKSPSRQVLGVFPERILPGNFIRYRYNDAEGKPHEMAITSSRSLVA